MSKLNPLHTPKFIYDCIAANLEYFDQARRTGRSTSLAFGYIAEALRKPHQWVQVRDHCDNYTNNNALRQQIMRIVGRQGFEHFTFKEASICFGKSDAHPQYVAKGATHGT